MPPAEGQEGGERAEQPFRMQRQGQGMAQAEVFAWVPGVFIPG